MSRNDTWMPLYLGDYLADTMHLNGAQHGAYLLLLMHYWRNGPLPDDDAQLANIAKTEPKAWRGMNSVIRAFFTTDGRRLRQKRMDKERSKADGISDGRSEAGKKGAHSRWSNGKPPDKPNGKPMANAMANASVSHRQNDAPLPSQSHINKSSLSEEGSGGARETSPPLAAAQDVANLVAATAKALTIRAYPPGAMPKRSVEEQIAAVTEKPPIKSAFLTPEQLALLRRSAG